MDLGNRVWLFSGALLACSVAWSQSPTYGVGHPATEAQTKAWDIVISPDGKELPPGQGTAKQGAAIYKVKCAVCHGPDGWSKNHAPTLIQSKEPRPTEGVVTCLGPCVNDANVIARNSPYATIVWDYVNRGMPLGAEGTLKPDEVYSLTAFLLFRNNVIREDEVMNAKTLPAVKMPNPSFAVPPYTPGKPRLQGYP
jgi:S-disulfanyl-L-cysteine oxidoreductase SoxD